MTSAIELEAFDGVVFGVNASGKPTISVPEDAEADLVERIRAAIRARVELVKTLPKKGVPHTAPKGECFTCKDPLPAHAAGLCRLCVCAREKLHEDAAK